MPSAKSNQKKAATKKASSKASNAKASNAKAASNKPAKSSSEKSYYRGNNAAQCAAQIRASRPDVGSGRGKLKAAFVEMVRSTNGRVYGTLVVIAPKKLTKAELEHFGTQIIQKAAKGTAPFADMKDEASKNNVKANVVTPGEQEVADAAKTTSGYGKPRRKKKAASSKGTSSTASKATKTTASKAATSKKTKKSSSTSAAPTTTSGPKTKTTSTKNAAGKTKAKSKTKAKRATSNTTKSRNNTPAPPPPPFNDADYERQLLAESEQLKRAHEQELAGMGLNGNVSGYPVQGGYTTGGYKLSTGVDGSMGLNPQGVRPIGSAQGAYAGGVVVGGYDPGMGVGLPPVYPGPMAHQPQLPYQPQMAVAGPSDDQFEAAWEKFREQAARQARSGSVGGAARVEFDRQQTHRSYYP